MMIEKEHRQADSTQKTQSMLCQCTGHLLVPVRMSTNKGDLSRQVLFYNKDDKKYLGMLISNKYALNDKLTILQKITNR